MSESPEPERKSKHKHKRHSEKKLCSGSPAAPDTKKPASGSRNVPDSRSRVARVEGQPRHDAVKPAEVDKYSSKGRERREEPRGGGYRSVVGRGYDEYGRMDPRTDRSLRLRLEEYSYDKPREEDELWDRGGVSYRTKGEELESRGGGGYKTDEEEEYDIGQEISDNVTRIKSVVTMTNRRSATPDRGRGNGGRANRRSASSDRGRSNGSRANRRSSSPDRRGRDADRKRQRGESRSRGSPADKNSEYLASKRKRLDDPDADITMRTGGAYIPPARLRLMQEAVTDKSSAQYQRLAWETLKKSINGLINKVNVSNLVHVVTQLMQENLVRGRGLLCRNAMQAQAASPTFTHVYAALIAIINLKFPQTGELLLKRLSTQFKKSFKRNDKPVCLAALRFIAHLVNQQVAHEILALEALTVLLETPTDDSVEVAIGFLKECGHKLTDVSPRAINAIYERLRVILHEGQIDKRVQYMVEVMFAIRKDGFKDHPAVLKELDLVPEDDQCTHIITLDETLDTEDGLNVFKLDPDYLANEAAYKEIKKELLDEGSNSDEDGSSGSGSSSSDDDDDDDDEDEEEEKKKQTLIIDETETNLVAFRRTVYLTIQSSLDYEECAHKLLKMNIKPGQEPELCNMILDCCAQQRTYEKFFGLLAQRFCMMDKKYIVPYQQMFLEQYEAIHRLETNKLRNVAKFFSHLLHTDAIGWEVLQSIKLNEEDTTSSSRIFIKILFQELSEYMGLHKLNVRLKDVTLQPFFEGLFPRDKPKNTRFAINFFTSIGLGGLTDELREHLKAAPARPTVVVVSQPSASAPHNEEDDSSSDSSSSSSSDDSSSSSSSSSEDDSSEEESTKKKKAESRKKVESRKKAETQKVDSRKKVESQKAESRKNAESQKAGSWKKAETEEEKDGEPTAAQLKLLALAYGEEAVRESMRQRELGQRVGVERGAEKERGSGRKRDRRHLSNSERSDDEDRTDRRRKEKRNDKHHDDDVQRSDDEDKTDRRRKQRRNDKHDDDDVQRSDDEDRMDRRRKERRNDRHNDGQRSDDEDERRTDRRRKERRNDKRHHDDVQRSDDDDDDRRKDRRRKEQRIEREQSQSKGSESEEEEERNERKRGGGKHGRQSSRGAREERSNRGRDREEDRGIKREREDSDDERFGREERRNRGRGREEDRGRDREEDREIKREREDSDDERYRRDEKRDRDGQGVRHRAGHRSKHSDTEADEEGRRGRRHHGKNRE